jgi:YjbR
MTLAQVRRFALSLADVTEQPHFDRTSFRIRGRIFMTARDTEAHVNVFVGEDQREPALAMHPELVEKLFWGGKVVGLKVQYAKASQAILKDLIQAAWRARA